MSNKPKLTKNIRTHIEEYGTESASFFVYDLDDEFGNHDIYDDFIIKYESLLLNKFDINLLYEQINSINANYITLFYNYLIPKEDELNIDEENIENYLPEPNIIKKIFLEYISLRVNNEINKIFNSIDSERNIEEAGNIVSQYFFEQYIKSYPLLNDENNEYTLLRTQFSYENIYKFVNSVIKIKDNIEFEIGAVENIMSETETNENIESENETNENIEAETATDTIIINDEPISDIIILTEANNNSEMRWNLKNDIKKDTPGYSLINFVELVSALSKCQIIKGDKDEIFKAFCENFKIKFNSKKFLSIQNQIYNKQKRDFTPLLTTLHNEMVKIKTHNIVNSISKQQLQSNKADENILNVRYKLEWTDTSIRLMELAVALFKCNVIIDCEFIDIYKVFLNIFNNISCEEDFLLKNIKTNLKLVNQSNLIKKLKDEFHNICLVEAEKIAEKKRLILEIKNKIK